MTQTPALRTREANQAPVRGDAAYVLYWMVANRRTRSNFALQRAVEEAKRLQRPLLVFEPLRCGYPWASDRLHQFVLDGMADHAEACAEAGVTWLGYVEPEHGAGRGLLRALARDAALVVTDEFPTFFIPRMVAAAAEQLSVRVEVVDANGILPLREAERAFTVAHAFRRHVHKKVQPHLEAFPEPAPLEGARALGAASPPEDAVNRWGLLRRADEVRAIDVRALPIDHVVEATSERGGDHAGLMRLRSFIEHGLPRYHEDRNHPDDDASSGLSPFLHFGHIGAHEVVRAAWDREGWTPDRVAERPTGKRAGWWNASEALEGFLDEIITWREVGYGFCYHVPNHDRFASLPDWAKTTLDAHAADPRPVVYTLEQFRDAQTHDEIWNAAQRQLVREGRMHNYLRMLWGKKILHWSSSPQQALEIMTELNNRFALDGRDPNSVSGIFWTLGRFDRAWGPERPVFGKIRYMTSASTRRKLRLKRYLEQHAEHPAQTLF